MSKDTTQTTLEERVERLEKLVDHLFNKPHQPKTYGPLPEFKIDQKCFLCGGDHGGQLCPKLTK